MKKYLALTMAACMALSLAACGSSASSTTSSSAAASTEATSDSAATAEATGSANITGIGILRKAGYEVQNRDFMRIGVPFTLAAIVPAYVYIWLFYGI